MRRMSGRRSGPSCTRLSTPRPLSQRRPIVSERDERPIKCPECSQTGADCTHDQDERRVMCEAMGVDPVAEDIYVASDPKAVERAAKRAKKQGTAEDADLLWLMRQPQGRRFMSRLLQRAGLYRISFNPAAPDPMC